MDLKEFLETSFYFLATINPASKIFLLSSMDPPYSKEELLKVSARSSLAAFLILAFLALAGNFVLITLFRIDLYSLKAAGGFVLFIVGLHAVKDGRFYEKTELQRVPDLSIVPLAAPLIAGPATIAASISTASVKGVFPSVACIALAVLANMAVMMSSLRIGRVLEKVNAIGPLVRITGLVVMSLAVQMMLTGLGEWLRSLRL